MNGVPIEVTLQGVDKVIAAFDKLERRMQQSIIGKAGRAALDVVVPIAKQNIASLPFANPPSKKNVRGTLVRSVRKKTSNKVGATIVTAMLDYKRGGVVKLAHLFEFGFNHPGGSRMRAHYMMSQAWETKNPEVQRILAERMKALIEQAVPS
jgi:HK97 gp10 family phage protein